MKKKDRYFKRTTFGKHIDNGFKEAKERIRRAVQMTSCRSRPLHEQCCKAKPRAAAEAVEYEGALRIGGLGSSGEQNEGAYRTSLPLREFTLDGGWTMEPFGRIESPAVLTINLRVSRSSLVYTKSATVQILKT